MSARARKHAAARRATKRTQRAREHSNRASDSASGAPFLHLWVPGEPQPGAESRDGTETGASVVASVATTPAERLAATVSFQLRKRLRGYQNRRKCPFHWAESLASHLLYTHPCCAGGSPDTPTRSTPSVFRDSGTPSAANAGGSSSADKPVPLSPLRSASSVSP